ncbi:MAG: hypothetical protein LLG15_02255 [Betaproteobacteria bacterium]|nr:hypothetical protein [Betaproteobacteria bacterium]
MRITVPGFSGVNRITAPQRLEDHQATAAIDCDFRSGDLRSFLGDQATGQALGGSVSSGTLFQFDPTHLIAASGKGYSFARSPTFYAESGTSDPRAIVSEAGQPPKWVTAADLTAAGTGLYTVNATLKRVGVPRPNRPTQLAFEKHTGDIKGYVISTKDKLTVTVADTDAPYLVAGGKVYLDAPGIPAGTAYTLTGSPAISAPDATVTLLNSKRSWKVVTVRSVKDTKTIRLVCQNHGFSDGDQVFFGRTDADTSLLGGAPFYPLKVHKVVNVTYDYFELMYHNGTDWVLVERTTAWNGSGSPDSGHKKKVALLAPTDNVFPDEALPTINDVAPGYHLRATATVNTAVYLATWTDADSADRLSTRAYVTTFVNAAGDESAPSDPTDPIDVVPKEKVTFKANTIPLTSPDYTISEFQAPASVRLYRTDATGQFRLLKELTLAELAQDYVDDKTDAALAEPLATTGWLPPPALLQGVINAPGGTVVGFQGKTVCPSVPYAPYAYPLAYRTACDYDIVGLVPTAAGIAVLTQGLPYLLTGTDPSSWAAVKLEAQQACVARRSIVDMGDYGMYASPDGLVAINGATVELVTREVMTRDQWQEYNPSTIVAAQTEGRYIATYVPLAGGSRKGFLYDPRTQTFTDLALASGTYVAMYNDLLTDTLLILNSNGTISRWNRGTSYTPYTWASKWFQLPIPELMGVAQILVTASVVGDRTLTFKLYGFDNNTVTEIYVASTTGSPAVIQGNQPFRLPYVAPGRFTAFRIILEGTLPVGMVSAARTMDEMKEV